MLHVSQFSRSLLLDHEICTISPDMLFCLPQHRIRTLERREHRDIFLNTSQNCASDSPVEFRLLKWYSEKIAKVLKRSKGGTG